MQNEKNLKDIVSFELKEIVSGSLENLKPKYREILVMRCYEEMDFPQIAKELGKTELGVRILFFRAKRQFCKILEEKGLNKI